MYCISNIFTSIKTSILINNQSIISNNGSIIKFSLYEHWLLIRFLMILVHKLNGIQLARSMRDILWIYMTNINITFVMNLKISIVIEWRNIFVFILFDLYFDFFILINVKTFWQWSFSVSVFIDWYVMCILWY